MQKIKIGDTVSYRSGEAKVTGIEMISPDTSFPDDDDNIVMQEIWACDKDRCVFDLDNKHWSWGAGIKLINEPKTANHENNS